MQLLDPIVTLNKLSQLIVACNMFVDYIYSGFRFDPCLYYFIEVAHAFKVQIQYNGDILKVNYIVTHNIVTLISIFIMINRLIEI
jgi:hypothetical protein